MPYNLNALKDKYTENKHLLRTEVDKNWLQLKAILEKNLKSKPAHVQANRLFEIHKIITKTNTLNLPVEDLINLRNMLDELSQLSSQLAPGMHSKMSGSNPRKEIKALLEKNQEGARLRADIEPKITNYIDAQRKAIANEIAYRNACQQAHFLKRIQEKYPEDSIESLILKRHEVSSNTHKGAGFNPDTGLDALHFPFSKQSTFELKSAQTVQTMQLDYMKVMRAIGHVDLMVSPVERAYETAMHATFSLDAVDTVFISSVFAEKQHALPMVSFSSRASKTPAEVAQKFCQPLECKDGRLIEGDEISNPSRPRLSYADDALLHYEAPWKFIERVQKVYTYLSSPFLKKQEQETSLRILAAHGGLNKEVLKYIKKIYKDKALSIPNELDHLDFGSHYQLVIVRDKNKQIKAIEYIGIYNRFGATQIPKSRPVMVEDRLAKMLATIESRRIDGEKLHDSDIAKVLFKYCNLEPKDSKVQAKILEKNYAKLMLDNLSYLKFKDPKRSQFIIESLLNHEKQILKEKKRKQNEASLPLLAGIAVVHQVTGKDYTEQLRILDKLKEGDQFVDSASLKVLLEKAKKTFSKGKVIQLIEAILRVQTENELVQAHALSPT